MNEDLPATVALLDYRVLAIDCHAITKTICRRLTEMLVSDLHRRGVVVGLSGGVDSSVYAAPSVGVTHQRDAGHSDLPRQRAEAPTTRYQHAQPLLMEEVREIAGGTLNDRETFVL